ncbi:DUF397 domain-containing protein [Streptomyces sp. 6N223]|uniref:DUF397 domain-containing protein n=1 Tax=Streptomyces sp. 6N223 TaxID=3457412 RepID=UPI003FD66DFD
MTTGAPISWQKSSFSAQGNNCIELACPKPEGPVHFRESEDPEIVLTTTPDRLRSLLAIVRSEAAAR